METAIDEVLSQAKKADEKNSNVNISMGFEKGAVQFKSSYDMSAVCGAANAGTGGSRKSEAAVERERRREHLRVEISEWDEFVEQKWTAKLDRDSDGQERWPWTEAGPTCWKNSG